MLSETHRRKRTFTVEEANLTLPLVSRIVEDLVRATRQIDETQVEADGVESRGDNLRRVRELRFRVDELDDEVALYLAELEAIGCVLKDGSQGVVDFPARSGNRDVLLCWRRGEPGISAWHEVDGGFDERRPVGELAL